MQELAVEVIEKVNNKNNIEHNPDYTFLHLSEEIGEVARELSKKQKNWREDFDKEKLSDELADVLGDLFIIAVDNGIDLGEAFAKKIEKVKGRFKLDGEGE